MSDLRFERAVKAQSFLRLALIGPAGAGKTWTGLTFATALSKKRVAVIDTERGSSRKYAKHFDFDVCELNRHSPDDYRKALDVAVAAGTFDVVLIDSLSHAWMGRDGALEQVDQEASRSKSGSSFAAWRSVTPKHNKLVDAITSAPLHVIATMRSKTEWLQEKDDQGRTHIRKIGTAPVQRDGLEFEFDVAADMEPTGHVMTIWKSRCYDLAVGSVIDRPGAEVVDVLERWLAGEVTPFSRVVHQVMAARSEAELTAVADEAKLLPEQDRQRLKPIYHGRLERLREVARQTAAAASVAEPQAELKPAEPVAEEVPPRRRSK